MQLPVLAFTHGFLRQRMVSKDPLLAFPANTTGLCRMAFVVRKDKMLLEPYTSLP